MPTLSRACPKGRVAQSLSESFRMKTPARVHFIHDLARLAALAISFQALRPCLAQTAATYHDRADQALQSFLIKFWDGGQQYLKGRYPDDGSLTGYWTYANGWDALLDGVERTGGQQYSGLIESLYLGQNERGWIVGYYDDECWMTLALLRAYDLTGDLRYLNQAEALYSDVETGWDTSCCGPSKGGMWWDKAHTQKATAANAGAALAGTRLYLRTGNTSSLDFAEQVYSYWRSNMLNSATFQVADHILPDGSKVWWRFTYNEGLMIGASVELGEATGDSTYLTNAHKIAGFMVTHEIASTGHGYFLYDGSNSDCGGDCHQFKGPAYRYLIRLYAKDTSRTQYYNVLKASADSIWNFARSTNSTTFAVNWSGPAQSSVDELQDNAACVALSRFAQQFGAYPGSGIAANQYEAENATLHHIGLEATYGGFTGWGYIAGWNGDGQWIDFNVNFAIPGPRRLTFRYAAGAGNATRLIFLDGANAFPNQSFPDTVAWSNYNTITVSYNFPAGLNTISVIYNSSLGSSNWLNLDNLTVTDPALEQIRVTGVTVSPAGSVQLTWNAISGQSYHVQSRQRIADGTWTDVGAPITASGATASASEAVGNSTERYYRIVKP